VREHRRDIMSEHYTDVQLEIDEHPHHVIDGEYSATFDLLAKRNSMHDIRGRGRSLWLYH
jgi:hypothetical protein